MKITQIKVITLSLLLLVALTGGVAASAQITPAWTAGTVGATNWNASQVDLGDEFTSNITGTVDALGIYAGNNASYVNPETVGLYNSSGTLLTSVVVTDTDLLSNGYYWAAPLTPASVVAGQDYTVVDYTNGNGWAYGTVNNNWATFNYDDYAYTNGLVYTSTQHGSGPAYLGPNVSVPEGGATLLYLLLAGGACFGAMFLVPRNRFANLASA